jgi:hypothetical protein
LHVLSTRGLQDGCFMPVSWAAEEAFSKVTNSRILNVFETQPTGNRIGVLKFRLEQIAKRLKLRFLCKADPNAVLFLMGFSKSILPILKSCNINKWIYLFDSWEPEWADMESIINSSYSIRHLFLSSSQATEHFRKRLAIGVDWIPQAAIASEFSPEALQWEEKSNTILNIGRSNSVLDSFFSEFATRHGFTYLRDEYPGQVKFKTRSDFLRALYSAKIVVVHPRNMQYPLQTGCVSMLTARNFEAYQSGGVVCGFKPQSGEFDTVLKDFPFIEYENSQQFECSLLSAIKNPSLWTTALLQTKRFHTWEKRAHQMKSIISST